LGEQIGQTETLVNLNYIVFRRLMVYTNINQKLVNSLHGLLNSEIAGIDCHVITPEYRTRAICIYIHVTTVL